MIWILEKRANVTCTLLAYYWTYTTEFRQINVALEFRTAGKFSKIAPRVRSTEVPSSCGGTERLILIARVTLSTSHGVCVSLCLCLCGVCVCVCAKHTHCCSISALDLNELCNLCVGSPDGHDLSRSKSICVCVCVCKLIMCFKESQLLFP